MNNYASVLQMKALYFPEYIFNLKSPHMGAYNELNYAFGVDYSINNNQEYKIDITIKITDKVNILNIALKASGIFSIDDNLLNGINKDTIIKRNTVAIMFPYIRSQITLLTTQPGMSAVIMPPINVNALIDDIEAKETQNKQQ